MNRTPELIAELRAVITAAPRADLPTIRGMLAALDAEVMVRLTTPESGATVNVSNGDDDELLDVEKAAKMFGASTRFMYKHADEYGGAKYGSSLKFSKNRLTAIIKRRSYSS